MADDRKMKNDLDKNMGTSDKDKNAQGAPGRTPKNDQSTGQRGGQSKEPLRGQEHSGGESQRNPGQSHRGQNR